MNDEVRAREILGDRLWQGTPRGLDSRYIGTEDDSAPEISCNRRWKEASRSFDETNIPSSHAVPINSNGGSYHIVSVLLSWASPR
jgi:hypothetical protein